MLYKSDYKGKYFVLDDEPDEMYGYYDTMEESELTDDFLAEHVDVCMYYGIPPYCGKDKELHERINKLIKAYYEKESIA